MKDRLKDWDAKLREHEAKRGSSFFFLIHPNGHGPSIDHTAIRDLLSLRDSMPSSTQVDIILHSPGGYADVAYRVMKFFRSHFQRVNVLVPLYAKSAASLMCLGADEILLGEFAELGPIDVQIHDPLEQGSRPISPLDDFQSMEFLKEYATKLLDDYTLLVLQRSGMSVKEAIQTSIPYVTEMMKPLLQGVNPFEVGGHYRALQIGAEYAKRLLKLTNNSNAAEIVRKLVWEYPSHDFVIDLNECREIGLPVRAMEAALDKDLVGYVDFVSDSGKYLHNFLNGPTPKTRLKGERYDNDSDKAKGGHDTPKSNSQNHSSQSA